MTYASRRDWLRRHLPGSARRAIQRTVLGYHSHAASFSGAGEDMILRHLIGVDRRNGFYVDVGAFHPYSASNTYHFYLKGWSGINIEARPGSRRLFQRFRPRDINIEAAVGSVEGSADFYVIDEKSTMNSRSESFLRALGMWDRVTTRVVVQVRRLAAILDEWLPAGRHIDFLNVDTEGSDLDVLRSNDWQRYRPTYVVVEELGTAPEPERPSSFLKSVDYDVVMTNVLLEGRLVEPFLRDRLQ
jgi:FkbM family methyltransferase